MPSLIRSRLGWLSVLCVFCSAPIWAETSERVALVVGNSAYKHAPLANPKNDAEGMAALLTRAGFKVDRQLDTDMGALQDAVARFGQTIKDPQVKFGLFYYAGHGLQQDWRNYLVPVDANIRSAADVPKQTVDVSQLLRYMKEEQGRSFLIILDACRDDPFAGTYKPSAKGLSQFDAPVGSLLAYATAPGNVAQDGAGSNGLYTSHLLKEFAVQGVRIEDAFKRVRLNVRMASRGQQVPWESTSLEEDLYLFPNRSRALTESEKDQLLEKEMKAWQGVKNSDDPEVLAGFIREFPSGSASELAGSRMNRLLAAMAKREQQKFVAAAQSAAQAAHELAESERLARLRAAEAEAKRVAAETAEHERLLQTQAQAVQEEVRRAQLAKEAAERAELARVAEEKARLAELEAARLARVAQAEAAQAARVAEEDAARKASLAKAEAELRRARLAQEESERLARLAEEEAAQRARIAEAKADQLAKQALQSQQQAERETQRIQALAMAAVQEEQARQQRAQVLAVQQELARLAALRIQRDAEERALQEQAQQAVQHFAQQAEQNLLEAQATEAKKLALQAKEPGVAAVAELVPTPYFKGYAEHQRSYQLGDVYSLRVIDRVNKTTNPLVMKVTRVDVDNERVEYNDGEYVSDLMGNTTTNLRGRFSTPRQFYPAELIVGKKWTTRFVQSRPNNVQYTFEYKLKVVGKETITVPAGTFETFKIEARGFNNNLGAYLERDIWVTPGVNADIAHEIRVRLRSGWVEQNDRQELVSQVRGG